MKTQDTIAIIAARLLGKLDYTQDELEAAMRKAREIYKLASRKEKKK